MRERFPSKMNWAEAGKVLAVLCVIGAPLALAIPMVGIVPVKAIARSGCEYLQGVNPGDFAFDCSGGSQNGVGSGYMDKWMAIAVSGKTLSWGASWQEPTAKAAKIDAFSDCAKEAKTAKDCKVVYAGINFCGALATSSPDGAWGVDGDRNGARAKAKAIGQCRKYGGKSCKVVTDPCSHDDD